MTDLDDRGAATRDLERIRALMERATRFSNLSGWSCIVAGLLAVAGAVVCWKIRANFNHAFCARPLALVWGSVLVLALAQGVVFTFVNARRRGEPVWSDLTRQVVVAMLPSCFVGAVITGHGLLTCQLDLLPPIWMLAYGMSLMALGLFAGAKIKAVGILFLLLGAAALWWFREYGLRMMLVSFGGLHVLLGIVIVWKHRV
ncbi:MAG: hypothetical protein HYY17_00390 [Planctomycetes bacterium]|nr:hypothetical protein [Planctomycetota bacterium]